MRFELVFLFTMAERENYFFNWFSQLYFCLSPLAQDIWWWWYSVSDEKNSCQSILVGKFAEKVYLWKKKINKNTALIPDYQRDNPLPVLSIWTMFSNEMRQMLSVSHNIIIFCFQIFNFSEIAHRFINNNNADNKPTQIYTKSFFN